MVETSYKQMLMKRGAEVTTEFTGLMNIALQENKMYAAAMKIASARVYGVPHGAPGQKKEAHTNQTLLIDFSPGPLLAHIAGCSVGSH